MGLGNKWLYLPQLSLKKKMPKNSQKNSKEIFEKFAFQDSYYLL
jgi:hypothetical protein